MTPMRNDNETTIGRGTGTCPVCTQSFRPVGRQRFCSPACRQTAWRARHNQTDPLPQIGGTRRRDTTVYVCGECEQRYLAEQWCPDCNRPCTKVGTGGLCPECDHPIALNDLLNQSKIR